MGLSYRVEDGVVVEGRHIAKTRTRRYAEQCARGLAGSSRLENMTG